MHCTRIFFAGQVEAEPLDSFIDTVSLLLGCRFRRAVQEPLSAAELACVIVVIVGFFRFTTTHGFDEPYDLTHTESISWRFSSRE
jgi:hypothetical protein